MRRENGMRAKRVRAGETTGARPSPHPAGSGPLGPGDFDGVVEKLKLLQFGLFGLQQLGRTAALDIEDIGPFTRLAEEIESDLLHLQQRLFSQGTAPSGP
jgi:hypothetical protein